MRKILNDLSDHYADVDKNHRSILAYAEMEKHPGWNTHKEMLMLCRGQIAEELLSKRFTELDATEKDVQQRAYSMVDDFIKFLLAPLQQAKKKAAYLQQGRMQREQFRQGFDREMTNRK
uniref:Uncharacterized protein n=1 Tax=viral metagenome TaxID=1070528 RepID=A0A6M3J1H7_9ZZZZ